MSLTRSTLNVSCIFLATLLAHASGAAETLDDGTRTQEWRLDNGLRVVVRDVPGAEHVALVLAYDVGREDDPEGQEGFVELMADAAYIAQAGDVPERTFTELDLLRPLGWNVQVERWRSEFGEIVTPQQFPGALHQMAQRVRGVRLTDAAINLARERRIEIQRTRFEGDLTTRLYLHVGELAAGRSNESLERWASGEALKNVRARDLARRIEEEYVPARAVLSLAGDFEGMNLEAFVGSEFGDIPSGTPIERHRYRRGSPSVETMERPGLDRTLGALGILAPALDDTLHPSFYLSMLMLGGYAGGLWKSDDGPLRSRFQFALLEDPLVARIYPPNRGPSTTAAVLRGQFAGVVQLLKETPIRFEKVDEVRRSVAWLLGAPLPPELRERIRSDATVLFQVARAAASRRLLGDASFWADYRRRFDPRSSHPFSYWEPYFTHPSNLVLITYEPKPKP